MHLRAKNGAGNKYKIVRPGCVIMRHHHDNGQHVFVIRADEVAVLLWDSWGIEPMKSITYCFSNIENFSTVRDASWASWDDSGFTGWP